jgi:hypothetical protein
VDYITKREGYKRERERVGLKAGVDEPYFVYIVIDIAQVSYILAPLFPNDKEKLSMSNTPYPQNKSLFFGLAPLMIII